MSKQFSKTVRVLQELKVHTSDVTCVEFWGNILLVTGSSDKTVRIWKWEVGRGFVEEEFSPLLGHKYGVTCVRISPQGGVLASSSVDGTIILWDLSNGSKTDSLHQENGEAIRACSFSPDGLAIASSDDSGSICIWGQNKNLLKTLRFHEETVYAIAFSSDSSILLTACGMGHMRLTMMDNSNESQNNDIDCSIDNAHDLGVLSVDFCKLIHTDPSDNQTTIYTVATCGSDHYVKIWRIYCLEKSQSNAGGSRLVPSSPSARETGSATIYSTDVMNAECVLSIHAHGSSVTCVRFNARGTFLATSSLDKAIKLWDLQGNLLQTLAEHSRYVNCISFNLNSSIIASGSNDRSIIIWDLSSSLTLDSHLVGPRSIIFNLASNQTEIPLDLICPITHEIMRDPVIAEDGFTYERDAILKWFERGKITSPMTNVELSTLILTDNDELKNKTEDFLKSLDFQKFEDF